MCGTAMSWMTMMGGLSYARPGYDAFVLHTQRDTRTMYSLNDGCIHEQSVPPPPFLFADTRLAACLAEFFRASSQADIEEKI